VKKGDRDCHPLSPWDGAGEKIQTKTDQQENIDPGRVGKDQREKWLIVDN
jgi:hypothetical protein